MESSIHSNLLTTVPSEAMKNVTLGIDNMLYDDDCQRWRSAFETGEQISCVSAKLLGYDYEFGPSRTSSYSIVPPPIKGATWSLEVRDYVRITFVIYLIDFARGTRL